jgi:hypoxanthine phosphoribosyltransferase
MTKIFMTWDEFDSDINEFISMVNSHEFDKNSVILALKRGGFTTACTLSNKLGIPISTVAFQTRDGNDVEPRFLEPEMINENTKIILPDDIYDTGLTVEKTVKMLVNTFGVNRDNILGLFHYGSDKLINSRLNKVLCIRKNNGNWCVFPWEST